VVKKIRYALQGAVALLFIATNTIILTTVMFLAAIPKLLSPPGAFRNLITRWLSSVGELWVSINKSVLWFYRGMEWDIQLPQDLDRNERYLVFCNHQSWVDILVLQHCLNRRAPFMRFMLKQQLIWVPFLGAAWWSLDMPFLRRYSRRELHKNPALRGKDLENAARACEKLKHIPVSMMSFPEGTRLTPAKYEKQKSPYRNLLIPRYGGIGQVLYSFGDALQTVIDVTIYYPAGTPTFWQLVSGQIDKVVVRGQFRTIDAGMQGINFRENSSAKRNLINWLSLIWKEKDQLLDDLAVKD
jgi:1-acyl-sn-glycerol-3-phosphate acyltransferase